MSYKAIDSNESFQVDEKGKIIDSILRSVTPDVDDKGAFINTSQGKEHVADLVKEHHGKEAAAVYQNKFNAYREAVSGDKETSDEAPKEKPDTEGEDSDPDEGKEISAKEKVKAVAEYFAENEGATYSKVKKALAKDGIKVNDQHVSKGKEAAGLK